MKLQKYISRVLALLVFFTLINCQDLNYDESTGNTNDEIFNDIARSKQFVSGIYAYLPTDYNSVGGAMRSSATDEAEHVNDLSDIQKFNDGSWSAVQQLDNVWNNMYNGFVLPMFT
jgi:starch-binding outer membrane protein, SusD/RagB family